MGTACGNTVGRFAGASWVAHWICSCRGAATLSAVAGGDCGCVVQEVPSQIVTLAADLAGRHRIRRGNTGHPDTRWHYGSATDTGSLCLDCRGSSSVLIGWLREIKVQGFSFPPTNAAQPPLRLSLNAHTAEKAPSKRDCGTRSCGAKTVWRREERHPGSLPYL